MSVQGDPGPKGDTPSNTKGEKGDDGHIYKHCNFTIADLYEHINNHSELKVNGTYRSVEDIFAYKTEDCKIWIKVLKNILNMTKIRLAEKGQPGDQVSLS